MNRLNDIRQKLAYASERREALFEETAKAQLNDMDVPFLGEKAGQVLATCRECFDYAAKDVFEAFILPLPGDPSFRKKYERGKVKVYFPFYLVQLREPNFWVRLRVPHPSVYATLASIAKGIEDKSLVPDTGVPYRAFAETNAMVNQKKHDRIIASATRDRATTIIQGNGTAVGVVPIGQEGGVYPNGAPIMKGPPGMQIRYVKDFFFDYNGERVGSYCASLITGTCIVMREIYTKYFGADPAILDPLKL